MDKDSGYPIFGFTLNIEKANAEGMSKLNIFYYSILFYLASAIFSAHSALMSLDGKNITKIIHL